MNRFEAAITTVLTLAIAALAAVHLRREFFPSSRQTRLTPPPVFVEGWESILPAGATLGDTSAVIKVIVFSDLQCPNCRTNHHQLRKLKDEHTAAMAVVFVHFPLPNHEFAYPAATAAECARARGNLSAFLDVVSSKQDSLGVKSWGSFAREAGLGDTLGFASCMVDSLTVAAVEAGIAIGRQFEIGVTPTVIINGWKFLGTPREADVSHLIQGLKKDPDAVPRNAGRR